MTPSLPSVKGYKAVSHVPPFTTAAWDAWQGDYSATTAVKSPCHHAERAKLKDGTMTREQVELLYDSGKLKSSGRGQGVLKKFAVDASQGAAKTEIHHDFPHMYEREFISIGLDPNTAGRKLPYDVHKKLHSAGADGGAFNYQWERFFEPLKNKNFKNPGDGLPRIDLTNPAESAEEFLLRIRAVDLSGLRTGTVRVKDLPWPFEIP